MYEALTNSIEAIKLLEDNNKKEIFIKLFLVPKLFSDETNSFRKMTLEEFAEQIENGLVNLQGIQGLKQVLKNRKQQPDER